ncbi:MAG: hypothetical protein ACOYI5_04570 [Christensenellales bacterium]|jgi:hypothetical protein
MGGILLATGFETFGVLTAWRLFARRGAVVRLWLGMSLGLVMMMWFPALFAFALGFTALAQWLGLALSVACAAASWRFTKPAPAQQTGEIPLKLLAALVIPLLILSAYLQHTHTLREVGGALHVGQSTFGDLCLHLGIATGLPNAAFPPDYTLIQGVELGYPFLADSMAASMLLFGTGLRTAFLTTGVWMMLLVYAGFAIFAWELTHRKLAVVLAFLLLFLNGGLGFLYVFDGAAADPSMLREVFTGYYRAPANMPDLNLRWVNVVCDLLIPQRTLLAGWMALLPALFLLNGAIRSNRRADFVMLGVWAGAMPMIHTHSFLALALLSIGALCSRLMRTSADRRLDLLLNFLIYGAIAALLSLPQLLRWTFPQTAGGGSLGVRLNWVNNLGDNRFIDGYFWFWIKNVGVTYLLLVPAALSADKHARALALGALCIYLVAEVVQFQPNPYDNNKLFYVAYIVMMPLVGAFAAKLWDRLKGLNCRVLFLAVFLLAGTLSGAMSLAREAVSDYQLFGADEVAAAAYIDAETDRDAVFLTGGQHNNPVAALAGRQIVCGTSSYLYFHGIDTAVARADARSMYESPGENRALFEQYGVEYVYLSSYEYAEFAVDTAFFEDYAEIVFGRGYVRIYKLTKGLYTDF